MPEKITNQDKILHHLFLVGRELSYLEVSRATRLNSNQIWRGMTRLKDRGLIKITKARNKDGTFGFAKVKVKNIGFAQQLLERKGLE